MPLPKDFRISENSFVEKGKVIDYNPNDSTEVTYPDGSSYPKNPRATYVDIAIQIMSGEDKGKKFVQENVNTGIYKGRNGRSQFYIWLLLLGVSEEKLEGLSAQSRPSINIMQTIGKTFDGVKKNKDGEFYVDLRDPERQMNDSADKIFEKEGTMEDNSGEVEEILGDLFSS